MSNLKIHLTVGASCSGKTTWAEDQVKKYKGKCVNVNRDDLRMTMFCINYHDYKFTKSNERIVTATQFAMARGALAEGKNVIVSDTNLEPTRWDNWYSLAKEFNAEVIVQYFPLELKELLNRNIRRERSTPENIIRAQFEKFESNFPDAIDYWKPSKYIRPEFDAHRVYIFDVDGTLAHMNNKRGPFEWVNVGVDDPDEYIIELLQMLYGCCYKIIIMSGRSDECMQETKEWLAKYGIEYDMLLMRAKGDYRPDTIVKDELFNNNIDGKYDVMGIFDDRDSVVEMWRNKGLKVMQVERGSF